jgi:hypothetical protein
MTQPLSTILAPLDRVSVEQERDRLREELADYEALLRLIDRHGAGSDAPLAVPQRGAGQPTNGNGNNGSNGSSEHKPLTAKRDAVLAILRDRPGRWSTADLRKALAERGIDPHAGTPVKNILWQLAKVGTVTPAGNGVYEFPPLSTKPDDPRVQEAMGV